MLWVRSTLPEEIRRAILAREMEATGLPQGIYDDEAHSRLAEMPVKMRVKAERKADIARPLLSAGKSLPWSEKLALVKARFGANGVSLPSLNRILRAVEGVDPVNFAPALLADYSLSGAPCAPMCEAAWSFESGAARARYLSPSILFHPKTRGAGLVHNPNLYLTALASQEDTMLPTNKLQKSEGVDLAAELAKMFNLPSDTAVADLLAKLAELVKPTPDPAKFIPVAAVQEMLRDRNTELSLNRQQRVTAKVQKAIQDNQLTNGMKGWAQALCESNESAFDEFCEKVGPTIAQFFKPVENAGWNNLQKQQPKTYDDSPLEQTICEQLGLKPGSLSN